MKVPLLPFYLLQSFARVKAIISGASLLEQVALTLLTTSDWETPPVTSQAPLNTASPVGKSLGCGAKSNTYAPPSPSHLAHRTVSLHSAGKGAVWHLSHHIQEYTHLLSYFQLGVGMRWKSVADKTPLHLAARLLGHLLQCTDRVS